jgi:RNA recognition motif-containing protein
MIPGSDRSKGCGIVEFATADEASYAIELLNDTDLMGRLIFVREDREGADGGRPARDGGRDRNRDHDRGDRFDRRRSDSPPRGQDRGRDRGSGPAVVTNGRVYVGNLAWDVDWRALKDHFRTCGEVLFAEVFTMEDGRSRGCGIVEFATNREAAEAITRCNDLDFRGRPMHVREDRKADEERR